MNVLTEISENGEEYELVDPTTHKNQMEICLLNDLTKSFAIMPVDGKPCGNFYQINQEKIIYENGKDYILTKDGKIKRLKGSKMPYFKTDEFYLANADLHAIRVVEEKEGVHFETPRYFAFGEKDFMI